MIVATGATPRWPEMEGGDGAHVVDAWQVLCGEVKIGSSALVADWRADWIGNGIAEMLAEQGCSVRLAVNGYMPGQTIQMYVRDARIARLHKLGVEIIPYVRLFGVDKDTVFLQHLMSADAVVCENVDTLVLAQGRKPENDTEAMLRKLDIPHHLVGDCISPRTAEEAVLEGLRVGRAV